MRAAPPVLLYPSLLVAAAVALLGGALGGCTGTVGPGPDPRVSTITLAAFNGAAYSQTVTITPAGTGTERRTSGPGGGVPPSARRFAVPPGRRAALLAALERAGVGRRRFARVRRELTVGGGATILELRGPAAAGQETPGDGLTLSTVQLREADLRRLELVFAAVRACVPPAGAATTARSPEVR